MSSFLQLKDSPNDFHRKTNEQTNLATFVALGYQDVLTLNISHNKGTINHRFPLIRPH